MSYLLETVDLSVAFGEQTVINKVSLRIPKQRFTSIIGPNGAGKTTLFNLLSGQLTPSQGTIKYKGQEITHLPPAARTRLGIGRSFQLTNLFPKLTVRENIRLAVQAAQGVRFRLWISQGDQMRQTEEVERLLHLVLLEKKADVQASLLAHGEKRKLELAMLLGLRPDVLLLDEPTAGISLEEVPAVLKVIESIKESHSCTIILIEHKMDMVKSLSDHMVVLFHGELLAEGTPTDMMRNEQVQSAYLGGLYKHDAAT
ncbi:ABC transporter ATP-binding protein [Brevibacillus sp. MS2.2]|uniref:ABC transporter ATP-binding protein n=1 Tax=Brevibacillus sp. MS2.2 TaxID=2738981 RepID=UPI00156A7725|nr:ABC transporter ATP-binding protein [Brevibacillus sp. MS2.2]NRR20476.1 ABC transporter ATP-binding protein [Brevibacillus sp. MS2.2]